MNHCTMFPDGKWGECCAMHDRRYENTRLTKWQADRLLYRCVKRKANHVIAVIMYAGVWMFGLYFYCKANSKIRVKDE